MPVRRCPVPLASDDAAEIIPELSSPGMLMTDGCHGAHGRNHGHRLSASAHQVPSGCCGGPGLAASGSGPQVASHWQPARRCGPACGQQPTSVSTHIVRSPSRGPACLAARIPAIAVGAGRAGLGAKCRPGLLRQPCRGNKDGPAGIKGQPCGNKRHSLRPPALRE